MVDSLYERGAHTRVIRDMGDVSEDIDLVAVYCEEAGCLNGPDGKDERVYCSRYYTTSATPSLLRGACFGVHTWFLYGSSDAKLLL